MKKVSVHTVVSSSNCVFGYASEAFGSDSGEVSVSWLSETSFFDFRASKEILSSVISPISCACKALSESETKSTTLAGLFSK